MCLIFQSFSFQDPVKWASSLTTAHESMHILVLGYLCVHRKWMTKCTIWSSSHWEDFLSVLHQSGATWAAVHFWLHVPNNPFMRTFPSLSAGHKGPSLVNIDMSWGRGTGATVMDDKGSQPPAGAAYLCAQVLVMPRPAILLPSFNGLLVDLPELLT